tara:strand:+ start:3801 stop:4847 length:1047 start_codon:yes stop_codon:yes gene_type:complete
MKHHEREYFVSRLRSGTYLVEYENFVLKIVPPTIEDEFYINKSFMDAFDIAYHQDLMTADDMEEWMYERGLWTEEDEVKLKELRDNIDKLKVQIFENRYKSEVRELARRYLRATEDAIKKQQMKKDSMFENTCEGTAFTKKCIEQVKRCTFLGSEPCDFSVVDANKVFSLLTNSYLQESDTRELARSEPWRSIWLMREDTGQNLFQNVPDRELTYDQKNICVWSRMYDNVQESTECPDEEVIKDDDMLDGWFIIQRKKQDQAKLESTVESMTKNQKIASSQEVYVFADNQKEAEMINAANNIHGQMIKKQRLAQVEAAGGSLQDQQLRDKQLELRTMSNEQYKQKFRR